MDIPSGEHRQNTRRDSWEFSANSLRSRRQVLRLGFRACTASAKLSFIVWNIEYSHKLVRLQTATILEREDSHIVIYNHDRDRDRAV